MKVLLFTMTLGPGGAERVLTMLAGALASRGHDVILLTLSGTAVDFYPVVPKVCRIGLNQTGTSGPLLAALANWKRVHSIRKVFAQERPDVVVSFLDRANFLALLASAGLRVPVIVAERTDPRIHQIGYFWSFLRRILYRRANRLVVQTKSVAQWARTIVPEFRVAVIPNPVAQATAHAPHTSSSERINILGMGRMDRPKGFDILLRAVKSVTAQGLKVFLSLYGDGPERTNLENLAKSLGLSNCVTFPGRTKDPAAALSRADIFVLSSRYEGFPNVLLEAMAVGTAVIAFDCPSGPAEIIEDGVSGLLVPNGDLDRLTDAIVRLARDPPLRSALASGAFARAAIFHPDKIVEEWNILLTEAVMVK